MCWNDIFTSGSSGLKDMESCPCIADSEQYLLPSSEGQRSVSPTTDCATVWTEESLLTSGSRLHRPLMSLLTKMYT